MENYIYKRLFEKTDGILFKINTDIQIIDIDDIVEITLTQKYIELTNVLRIPKKNWKHEIEMYLELFIYKCFY